MSEKTIVTCGKSPDADGLACAVVYAAYKNATQVAGSSKEFLPVFCSSGKFETQYLLDVLQPLCIVNEAYIEKYNSSIIVDASEERGMPGWLNFASVVEVIDHRKFPNYNAFPNARFQIEIVGAAATLIAEKFYFEGVKMSLLHANLLLCAIYSNTSMFTSQNTTERDIRMRDWLIQDCNAEVTLAIQMLQYSTQRIEEHLEEAIDLDSKIYLAPKLHMYQLEVLRSVGIRHKLDSILPSSKLFEPPYVLLVQDLQEGATFLYSNKSTIIDQVVPELGLVNIKNGVWKSSKIHLRKDVLSHILLQS